MTCDGNYNGGMGGKCVDVVAGDDPLSNCTGTDKCDGHGLCLCANGVKDTGEAGVDCGGSCPNKCGAKSTCINDTDCMNNTCSQGYCCNMNCGGTSFPCYSCAVPGSEGMCTSFPTGQQGGCPANMTCDTGHHCHT
jgi:hypothetical protein